MIRMEQGGVPAKQNREALMPLHRALPVGISTLDIQKILAPRPAIHSCSG